MAALDVVTVTLNAAIDRTITIPNFTVGAVNRVAHEGSAAGGKGINVAAALAGYGLRVGATGFLGRANTALFESLFARTHIEDACVRVEGDTRVGIKIADPALKGTTDINFPGTAPAEARLDELRRRIDALDATWWVLSGSLPPGVDAGIYRDLIGAVKARGGRVAVDTSGEPLRQALESAPHVSKPNVHELEALLGGRLPDRAAIVAAARELARATGTELLVVSMGADGACFVTSDATVIARPPAIEVRSTVGAGDAMVAGIVAARLGGLPLDACARLATAFAVHALGRVDDQRGARAGIEAAAERVEVERIP